MLFYLEIRLWRERKIREFLLNGFYLVNEKSSLFTEAEVNLIEDLMK